MIRPLRRVHRAGFVLLALVLPALLLAALRSRASMLRAEERLATAPRGDASLEAPHATLEADLLSIELPLDWNEPDVLVYAARAPATDGLPPSARLVGALVPGRRLPWPEGSDAAFVVLYSLAHQEALLSQRVGGAR